MSDDRVRPAFDQGSSLRSGECRGRDAIDPVGQPTSLSELFQQVLAAWIVALFVFVAGCSVLVFYARDVREGDSVTAGIPRWHSPPVAGPQGLDEIPDHRAARAGAVEGDGAP
jgi:hypothetical protein